MSLTSLPAPDFSADLTRLLSQTKNPTEAASRTAALANFRQVGLPSRKQDSWHYTTILPEQIANLKPAIGFPSQPASLPDFGPCHLITSGTDFSQLPFTCKPITVAPSKQLPLTPENSFCFLNAAMFTAGFALDIPANSTIAEPIILLHTLSHSCMQHPGYNIYIGSNAKVTLVEYYLGSVTANYLCNSVTKITLETGAKLTHLLMHEGASKEFGQHIASHNILVGSRAELDAHIHSLNIKTLRNSYHIATAGTESKISLAAMLYNSSASSNDLDLAITHGHDNGYSRSLIRSIAADTATTSCTGQITVQAQSCNCDADFNSKSLVLGQNATANNRPRLEIYNDEVKCSHGSSTGQLDEDALFYFQSRGIAKDDARALLITSFLYPVLEQIPVPYFKNRLYTTLGIVEPSHA